MPKLVHGRSAPGGKTAPENEGEEDSDFDASSLEDNEETIEREELQLPKDDTEMHDLADEADM